MLTAETLTQALDPLTGQIAFTIELATVGGRNGLGFTVSAGYGSAVLEGATLWNLDAPTGVLGLGWTLGTSAITATVGDSATPADRVITLRLGGVRSVLVRTGTASDGTWTYACENYRFWRITYDPTHELWTVVDETGTTHRFGDTASARGTVDYGVAWGGWTGPSGAGTGQTPIATGWSLSEVSNRFGDTVTYGYRQDSVAVVTGGASFTRATYLASVTGVDGTTVSLAYADKDPDEYQDPHSLPAPPNGWQDRYETLYLAGITVASADGTVLQTLAFGYATIGTGTDTSPVKRLLTSVERCASSGQMIEPATEFAYWGQGQSDGVSSTTVFNSAKGALYGALAMVTLPAGGTVQYSYATVTPQYGDRSSVLKPPTGGGSPRLYFDDDYTLVTWVDGAGTVTVQGQVWAGRWLRTDITSFALPAGTAYDALQVGTGAGVCAILAGGTLLLLARDTLNPGGWLTPQTVTVALSGGEAAALAVGSDFACVLGLTSGVIHPYRLTGTSWSTTDATVSLAAGGSFALGAEGHISVAAAVPADGGDTSVSLLLRDTDGDWVDTTASLDLGGLAGTASIAVGGGLAVVCAADASASLARYGGVTWDLGATALSGQPLLTSGLASDGAVTAPVVAGATVGLPGLLVRWDGAAWNGFAPSGANPTDATAQLGQNLGYDLCARRFSSSQDGTELADLLVYDPIAATWTVPSGLRTTVTGSAAVTVPMAGDAPGNYAVVGNALWYREPDGTWTDVLDLKGTDITSADLDTITIADGRFMVMQIGTGGDSALTSAWLLQNGGITATSPITLSGERFVPDSGGQGPLVGLYAFATFTGSYGSSTSTLTLHRPLTGEVSGQQDAYAVSLVVTNNQYGSTSGDGSAFGAVSSAVSCDATGATIDPTGRVPLFNMVTTAPGSTATTGTPAAGTTVTCLYNGLSADEDPAEPWPERSDTNNVLDYRNAGIGLTYSQTSKDSSGNAVASTASQWTITAGTLGTMGRSAYSRCRRVDETLDGVTGVTLADYRGDTGFPSLVTVQTTNASGGTDSFSTEPYYWWQQYDTSRTTNMLAPLAAAIRLSTPAGATAATVIGVTIQTWRSDWGHGAGQWAPDRLFRATAAPSGGSTDPLSGFTAWDAEDPAPTSGYLMVERVLARNAHGLQTEAADALGTESCTLYDRDGVMPVASAANCADDPSMLSWFGCEPYEASGAWVSSDPALSVWSYVTTADYHTGSQCLALPAGASAGPQRVFTPTDQTRLCLFSCWARQPDADGTTGGSAQWTITPTDAAGGAAVTDPDTGTAVTITLTLTPPTDGGWSYNQITIDLPGLYEANGNKAVRLTIVADNGGGTGTCYLDELRFMPIDCGFAATVYQLSTWRPLASIDGNGQSGQVRYDGAGRPFLRLGPLERVEALSAVSHSRALTSSDSFLASFPNMSLTVTTGGGTVFYDFHDGDLSDWTCDSGWAINGGALTYTPAQGASGSATAKLKTVAYTYVGLSIRITSDTLADTQTISFGGTASADAEKTAVNNGVFMSWNQQAATWSLVTVTDGASTTVQTNTSVPFGRQWLFVCVDGWIMCWVDALPLFAHQLGSASSDLGILTIQTNASASFDDAVELDQPQLGIGVTDGLGVARQSLAYAGSSSGSNGWQSSWQADGVLPDSLGRPSVGTVPQQATGVVGALPGSGGTGDWTLLKAGQSNYLCDASGSSVSVTQYLGGSGGYTYTQATYDSSPLARVTAATPPHGTGTAASECQTSYSYGGSGTVGGDAVSTGALYRIATASWVQAKDGAGTVYRSLRRVTGDSLGRTLMVQEGPTDGTLLQTGCLYDSTGRLATIRQPNYYAPPSGTDATAWQETVGYDYLGRETSRTTPDSGQTQFIHDSLGRVRFVLDATGAALSPQRILYTRYDALSRVVETGYIQDASWSWSALAAKADDEAFPAIGSTAAGSWRKRFTHDTTETFSGYADGTLHLIGRTVTAAVNQNGDSTKPDTESYRYDACGNATAKTVGMPTLAAPNSWTVTATYDNQDRIATLAYPDLAAAAAATALTVSFTRDRLGRLAGIGEGTGDGTVVDSAKAAPAVDTRWAAYGYDQYGLPHSITYNKPTAAGQGAAIARSLTYDAGGRLTGLSDGYFAETLGYDDGSGFGGWSYCDGSVASAASAYEPSANWSPSIPGFTQAFAYDRLGRLVTASNTLSNAFSLGTRSALTYDANGNQRTGSRNVTAASISLQGTAGSATNRVATVGSSIASSLTFNSVDTGATAAAGWSWGSSNGGPSATTVETISGGPTYTGTTTQATKALGLAGGGLGHYERMCLETYLAPDCTYTVSWQVKTGDGFGQAVGRCGWYLVLYAESGPSVAVPVQAITAADGWQSQSTTLRPADYASLGLGLPVVAATLELRNQCRMTDGSPGPTLLVAQAGVSGTVTGSAFAYDGDGSVTGAPDRGIDTITYDPTTRLATALALTGGDSLGFFYGADDRRSRQTASGTGAGTTITLTGFAGEVLGTRMMSGDSTSVSYYLTGPEGTFGRLDSGDLQNLQVLLGDHLGSLRVVVDGVSGTPQAAADVMPFGGAQRRTASGGTSVGFTGQRLDDRSGLYNFNARLYDPALGRFYATDPAAQSASPYVYCDDEPVNRVDPDGLFFVRPPYISWGRPWPGRGTRWSSILPTSARLAAPPVAGVPSWPIFNRDGNTSYLRQFESQWNTGQRGHTYDRHIDRNDTTAVLRLIQERVPASGVFLDEATANVAVNATSWNSHGGIVQFIRNPKQTRTAISHDVGYPVGYSFIDLRKYDKNIVVPSGAQAVSIGNYTSTSLLWLPTMVMAKFENITTLNAVYERLADGTAGLLTAYPQIPKGLPVSFNTTVP